MQKVVKRMDDIKKDPFEEYIKNLPPSRKEMGQAWSAAIGLQDVDGLKNIRIPLCYSQEKH